MAEEMRSDVPKKRPKVGVVVGSGGIKAVSCIPLFEFIDEAQIPVDLLIGCSGGSIVGSYWASRQNASQLRDMAGELWQRELFLKVDYTTLLSIAGVPFVQFDKRHGLVKPDGIHKTLKNLFGDMQIEDVPTRLMLQSTDLLTGEPVLMKSGPLWSAVYASSALFPILPPIHRESRWLVDGANSSPVPILEAVNNDMDVIIAWNNEVRSTAESDSFFSWFIRCMTYQSIWLTRNQLALSVDMHHHEIIFINVVFEEQLGLKAVDSIPKIIQTGQSALDAKKEDILEAINSYK